MEGVWGWLGGRWTLPLLVFPASCLDNDTQVKKLSEASAATVFNSTDIKTMTDHDIQCGIALRDRIKAIESALTELPNYRRGYGQSAKTLDEILHLHNTDIWHLEDAMMEILQARLETLEKEFEAL